MQPFSWTCPYCNRITTITNSNISFSVHNFESGNESDNYSLQTHVITCPNDECRDYTIEAKLWRMDTRQCILSWNMKPQSHAKQFPNYVPKPIIANYQEAGLIQNLSPKASATLARRCLQGMIRDFWGIKERTLFAEINAIQGKVDPRTWNAIDAVRSVGNIGAHMEKDINLIIDVEPNEAEALIKLIEILIKDWYIARQERENALASVIGIGNQKSKERKGNKQT